MYSFQSYFIHVAEKSNPMVQLSPQKSPKSRTKLERCSKWLTHKYENVSSAHTSPHKKANHVGELM